MNRFKLICCNALAPVLLPLVGEGTEVRVLDIGLHVNPNRLRDRVQAEVKAMDQPGIDIHLGYGLCGRGLEGVCSANSRLVLPCVDDCVGALLGSRQRHRKAIRRRPGCYFMEPSWLDTEMNIFAGLMKGMEHIPAECRDRVIGTALKHYTALALLVSGRPNPLVVRRCEEHARAFSLELVQIRTDLTLLQRLIRGPLDSRNFVIVSPGEPIPFF